jgi:hypothetical protein
MTNITLSDELRRFIQAIDSIPHLEAMLILRQGGEQAWDENAIAKRLYLNTENAACMLSDLCAAGICIPATTESGFIYAPTENLRELINQLAVYYAHHLIEVTNMIHAKNDAGRGARLFANAFLLKNKD